MQGYAVAFGVVPFLFGLIGVLANRRGGRWWLWGAWVAVTAVLETLAIVYWRQLGESQMPVAALLLLGFVPTLAGVYAIRWAEKREMPFVVQVLVGGTASWLAITPTLMLGMIL